MITGKYFAMSYGCDSDEIAVIVYNYGPNVDGSTRGQVINGAWNGLFWEEWVFVEGTGKTFPARVLWQGPTLITNNDYGFRFVRQQLEDGYGYRHR